MTSAMTPPTTEAAPAASGESLFGEHLDLRLAGLAEDLEAVSFEALVLDAGVARFHYRDDQAPTFRANAHFLHFCPAEAPGHLLLLRPGEKPLLAAHLPDDYWYESPEVEDAFWADRFEIARCGSLRETVVEVGRRLGTLRAAYVGERRELARALGLAADPVELLHRLDWRRAEKTPYEIAQIAEANRLGAGGHRAAEEAFREGGSELEIHRAFVAALNGTEADLPYPTIVGIEEKGAVLHYEGKRVAPRSGKSLLLDAGARVRGYASDITRTYAAAHADPRFRELIGAVDRAQRGLADRVRAGIPWASVHEEAHLALAGVLREAGVLRISPEAAVENELSAVFFPHGLGHHLGVQVHDVGGHLRDREGRRAPPPKNRPHLRSTRTLEPGQVVTVEPGVYFIESLLREWRERGEAECAAVEWEAVEALRPYGGVRVEDDVLCTGGAPRNLTREHLPD